MKKLAKGEWRCRCGAVWRKSRFSPQVVRAATSCPHCDPGDWINLASLRPLRIDPPASTKLPVTAAVRVKAFDVFHRAVLEGVATGWSRAHEHTRKPSAETIKDAVEQAVINAVDEVFDFGEPGT